MGSRESTVALTLTMVPPAPHPPRADISSRSQHSRCAEETGPTAPAPAPPWASTSPPEKWVCGSSRHGSPSSPFVPGLELGQQRWPPPLGLDDGARRQVGGVVTGVVLVLEQPHVLQREDRGTERRIPTRPSGPAWRRAFLGPAAKEKGHLRPTRALGGCCDSARSPDRQPTEPACWQGAEEEGTACGCP